MPHQYSLKTKKEIDELFVKGIKRHSHNLTIVYLPSDKTGYAFITPKKHIKLASQRNYSRRVMREAIRTQIHPRLNSSYKMALICKTNFKVLKKNYTFEKLIAEIKYLLHPILIKP